MNIAQSIIKQSASDFKDFKFTKDLLDTPKPSMVEGASGYLSSRALGGVEHLKNRVVNAESNQTDGVVGSEVAEYILHALGWEGGIRAKNWGKGIRGDYVNSGVPQRLKDWSKRISRKKVPEADLSMGISQRGPYQPSKSIPKRKLTADDIIASLKSDNFDNYKKKLDGFRNKVRKEYYHSPLANNHRVKQFRKSLISPTAKQKLVGKGFGALDDLKGSKGKGRLGLLSAGARTAAPLLGGLASFLGSNYAKGQKYD